MQTDFKAVRHHLACSLMYLGGRDETTDRFREALDLMIDAATVAEQSRSDPKVVHFGPHRDRC